MKFSKIQISKFGDVNVLEHLYEENLPSLGNGQVLIKVLATSISYTDTLIRRGIYPSIGSKLLPLTPGYDMIGKIEKLGKDVEDFNVGELVASLTIIGSYSQYIVLDSKKLVSIPNTIDISKSVSLILTYVTAYQMLHRVANIKKGDKILIHGAGGTVGKAILELGKILELKMYGTGSLASKNNIEKLGGIFIDYKNQDFVEYINSLELNGIDAVFDPIGGKNFSRSLKILKKTGILVAFGFHNSANNIDGNKYIDFMKVLLRNLTPTKPRAKFYLIDQRFKKKFDFFKQDLNTLIILLKDGKIDPPIYKKIGFDEVKDAHLLVENNNVKGKIILLT